MFCFLFLIYHTLQSQWDFFPMGNSGRFPPKESQLQQSRATQPLLITKCTLVFFRVCVIHPNSDMDYTICNVQDVIILLRVHTGAGHTDDDVRVSTTSLTRKKSLTILSCPPGGVRTSGLWVSSRTLYQLSHPVPYLFRK